MCDKGWMSSLRAGHTACLGRDRDVVVFGGSSNMCTSVWQVHFNVLDSEIHPNVVFFHLWLLFFWSDDSSEKSFAASFWRHILLSDSAVLPLQVYTECLCLNLHVVQDMCICVQHKWFAYVSLWLYNFNKDFNWDFLRSSLHSSGGWFFWLM